MTPTAASCRTPLACALEALSGVSVGWGMLDRSQARRAAGAIAAARVALGAVAFVAPTLPARPWVGRDEAVRTGARLLARALGARDLALGVGACLALRRGSDARRWVEAGGLADAGDTVATLVSFRSLPTLSRWAVLASTVGAAAGAALLAPLVDR
ncbi:MAG: hypothetical protein M0Z33_04795 [Actinomycetota bacterium]|nr:hypothetical protein [Actinomycetota bacterium]